MSEDLIQYLLDITNNNLNISKRIINRFMLGNDDMNKLQLLHRDTIISALDKEELKEEDRNGNKVEPMDDNEVEVRKNKDLLKAIYVDIVDKFAISYFKNVFHIEPSNISNNMKDNNCNTNDKGNIMYYLDPTTHNWMEVVRKFHFSENQQVILLCI